MAKGPGLYSDIAKKARDLLYKDYQSHQKFTLTTYSPIGVNSIMAGYHNIGNQEGGELFLADVTMQLKQKYFTTDLKVDTDSNLIATIRIDESVPGLNAMFSFHVPDQRSGKVEFQYLNDYTGISTNLGFTANPVVNFCGVLGTNNLAIGADLSFDTKSGDFTKLNAGVKLTHASLVATVTLNDEGDALDASYYQLVNPLTNTAVGAELCHRFSTNVNTFTLGAQHALDCLTMLKARANSFGKVNALIKREWHPRSFFTISGEVDTKALKKSAKIGLALALMP